MVESESATSRITPADRHALGWVNTLLLKVATRRGGGGVPNVILTIGRHRSLMRSWLWFSSKLMPYGILPPTDTELVILRVASRSGSAYERRHHEAIGRRAGLGPEIIAWTAEPIVDDDPPADDGIGVARAAALMRATDELFDDRDLSEAAWMGLRPFYTDEQLIELCLLVGHYAGLAGMLNALRVEQEPPTAKFNVR